MPLIIVREDLTQMQVDAVVNTTNIKLQQGDGGVSAAIFKAAGTDILGEACDKIGGCDAGHAVLTPGFGLPAKYIIHTPSMVWKDGLHGEKTVLHSCYQACLRIAADKGLESLAFPLIGSGAHGYPKHMALTVATQEINSFLMNYDGDMTVFLAVFGHHAFALSKKLTGAVHEYVNDLYVDAKKDRRRRLSESDDTLSPLFPTHVTAGRGISEPTEPDATPLSFAQSMIQYIDSHKLTDPLVYKRANITKQYYYKIKIGKSKPGKSNILALCVAMKLDLKDTVRFLRLAGYAFSPASQPDIIVQSYIKRGICDVTEINIALFDQGFDKYQLGSAEK